MFGLRWGFHSAIPPPPSMPIWAFWQFLFLAPVKLCTIFLHESTWIYAAHPQGSMWALPTCMLLLHMYSSEFYEKACDMGSPTYLPVQVLVKLAIFSAKFGCPTAPTVEHGIIEDWLAFRPLSVVPKDSYEKPLEVYCYVPVGTVGAQCVQVDSLLWVQVWLVVHGFDEVLTAKLDRGWEG